MVSIYYSHSKRLYGTQQEQHELSLLSRFFPHATIINPAAFSEQWRSLSEAQIIYECKKLIDKCDIVVFSSTSGYIGRGSYDEVMYAFRTRKSVFFLFRDSLFCPTFEDIRVAFKGTNWASYASVFPRPCP